MTTVFSLSSHNTLYESWRDGKLAPYPLSIAQLMTEITDPTSLQANEIASILQTAAQFNCAFYRLPAHCAQDKSIVHHLASACGLRHIQHNLCADADSLTSLQVTDQPGQSDYIPYTEHRLNWHTDGYYNPPEEQIQGVLLHCVRPAQQGGTNWLMDHEIAYILLREADPAYIAALMHPRALTIPANIRQGTVIRPEQSGPVFSVNAAGKLHMRYSARQRNVIWRDDVTTRRAAQFLLALWAQDSVYKLQYTLQRGEGLLCNNSLHCRSSFTDADDPVNKRLLYRGRYVDRLAPPGYAPA